MLGLHGVNSDPTFFEALDYLGVGLIDNKFDIFLSLLSEKYIPSLFANYLRFCRIASSSAPLVVPHILCSLLFTVHRYFLLLQCSLFVCHVKINLRILNQSKLYQFDFSKFGIISISRSDQIGAEKNHQKGTIT